MNIPNINEVIEKERRVREYLDKKGFDAMILGRIDNFAWFTDGGNSRVINSTEFGFSILVITRTKKYLVSQVMDGARVMDDELSGIDIEYVPLRWYEMSREEKALELAGGGSIVSDMPLKGAEYLPKDIYSLHYPLTNIEIQKLRLIGQKTEEIIAKVAAEIKPGMTEHEIEAMFLYEYGVWNAQCDVLLIGSDERIFKYRHPNPSKKRVDKYVLLHPAIRKWGLHANVTRMVYFGDTLPAEIESKYKAACQIEAAALSMCKPGTKFSDILAEEKMLYKSFGFEDEWRNHFQGGITGYMVADPTLCMNPENVVMVNQAYDWFITITGAKVEELSINTGNEVEFVSVTGKWPTEEFEYNGMRFNLPVILKR